MNAGEILNKVEGLTHDKLTYFVRAGYLQPRKIKKGTLYYNVFSERDFLLVSKAWSYIVTYDMKTRSAFKRAEAEIDNPQLKLFQENVNR